eukprot:m.184070 g.184070  ORF g.184070 m.184070 type:complete len:956 (-) comp15556_c0_seq4:1472-4339(-)
MKFTRLLMLCLTVIKQNLEKISPLLSRNQNMDYFEGYSLGAVLDSDVTLVADDRGFGVWSVTMTIISEWWRRNGLNSLVEEKGRKDTTVDKELLKMNMHASKEDFEFVGGVVHTYLSDATAQLPMSDSDWIQFVRDMWRSTCKAWRSVHGEGRVEYSKNVALLYACGTTPTNSLQMINIFSRVEPIFQSLCSILCKEHSSSFNALVLCGGSGAEAVALCYVLHQIIKVKKASQEMTSHINVTVVDKAEEWRESLNAYASHLQVRFPEIQISISFFALDLLSTSNFNLISSHCSEANLITLVYGLSEMHDLNRPATESLLQHIFRAMKAKSSFLVVDPVSLQHSEEKSSWLEKMAPSWGLKLVHEFNLKTQVSAALFNDSQYLCDWLQVFQLRVGHDVKVFANSWCQFYTSQEKETSSQQAPRIDSDMLERSSKRTKTSEGTAEENQRCPKILVVVPDNKSESWCSSWAKVDVACKLIRLTGNLGNKFVSVVCQKIKLWNGNGGILLLDYGNACLLLCSDLPPIEIRESALAPNVLILEGCQKSLNYKRRSGKTILKLHDGLMLAKPEKLLLSASISFFKITRGDQWELLESATFLDQIRNFANNLGACMKPNGHTMTVIRRPIVSVLRTMMRIGINYQPQTYHVQDSCIQTSIRESLSPLELTGMLLSLFKVHPALLEKTRKQTKLWTKQCTKGQSENVQATINKALSLVNLGLSNQEDPCRQSGRLHCFVQIIKEKVTEMQADEKGVKQHNIAVFCSMHVSIECIDNYSDSIRKGVGEHVKIEFNTVHGNQKAAAMQKVRRGDQKRALSRQHYQAWLNQTLGNLTTITDKADSAQQICYNYNWNHCRNHDCNALHVCDSVFCENTKEPHPRSECKQAAQNLKGQGDIVIRVQLFDMAALDSYAEFECDTLIFFDNDLSLLPADTMKRRMIHALSLTYNFHRKKTSLQSYIFKEK